MPINDTPSYKYILFIIVLAQFCCTSLWFAGNGIMDQLILNFGLEETALAHLTSAVQFGFIIGTLLFAILTMVDRYSPSRVFFFCALLGAGVNLLILWQGNSIVSLLAIRFLTGFFLAGIYPVGMKIATDYFEKGLGKSLGFLVGALVLGTALPHLLKGLQLDFSWKFVIITTSILAILGGLFLLIFVPNGPFRKPVAQMDFSAFFEVFRNKTFRKAAFGYFGHMWELYSFWAFVPIILNTYKILRPTSSFNVSICAFFIIAIGGFSCFLSGYIAQTFGTKKTAFYALLLSCICCLISPFAFNIESQTGFYCFLLLWGMFVIADSPMFSTLVAQNAPSETKGTALTIVNCIGFAITILSIQFISLLKDSMPLNTVYTLLAIGPLLGLIALWDKQETI